MNRKARRAGLFIGGVLYGLIRGIFFKNKYWFSYGGEDNVQQHKYSLARNHRIL